MCTKLYQTTEKCLLKSIFQDINVLQCATSPEVFTAIQKIFWRKSMSKMHLWHTRNLKRHGSRKTLISNPNWYLSTTPISSPGTNNALESFNRIIKDANTLCERIPLSRFLFVAEDMVTSWSQQATEELFATTPVFKLADWTAGYLWAKTDTKIRIIQLTPTTNTYLVPGDNFTRTL